MRHISTGSWGGHHISMKVGAKSATIEYDCANGVIDGPLVVDDNGHFNLRGTHRTEHGGPIRADESSKGQPATYTGAINGNTMTLHWETPNNMPFPMPVDVVVNGKTQRVEMKDGKATVNFTGTAPVIDPNGWVLKAQ